MKELRLLAEKDGWAEKKLDDAKHGDYVIMVGPCLYAEGLLNLEGPVAPAIGDRCLLDSDFERPVFIRPPVYPKHCVGVTGKGERVVNMSGNRYRPEWKSLSRGLIIAPDGIRVLWEFPEDEEKTNE